MEKTGLARAEIETAGEKLSAFGDDYRAGRWGNATVNLFFALEHSVKALLAGAGMEAATHEGVKVLFSMHFIKPGTIRPILGRYLGNLYDRRVAAEYSPLRRSEFTKEEVDAYLSWVRESLSEILPLIVKYGVETGGIEAVLKTL